MTISGTSGYNTNVGTNTIASIQNMFEYDIRQAMDRFISLKPTMIKATRTLFVNSLSIHTRRLRY